MEAGACVTFCVYFDAPYTDSIFTFINSSRLELDRSLDGFRFRPEAGKQVRKKIPAVIAMMAGILCFVELWGRRIISLFPNFWYCQASLLNLGGKTKES
jgi:hypothetical protein